MSWDIIQLMIGLHQGASQGFNKLEYKMALNKIDAFFNKYHINYFNQFYSRFRIFKRRRRSNLMVTFEHLFNQ